MSGYEKQKIINTLRDIKEISKLYNNDIINYTGRTTDTQEKYTEVIAKEILDNPKKYDFTKITEIKRGEKSKKGQRISYKIDTHDGECNENSPRGEENFAMALKWKNSPALGKIIDYQVPLKNTEDDTAGKIDLVSSKASTNTCYLIELKNDKSNETLLRCVLEIKTYYQQLWKEKFKADFKNDFINNSNPNIKPAILIVENTRPYFDLEDEYVKKLIDKFNIDLFIIKPEDVFIVKEKKGNTTDIEQIFKIEQIYK